MNGSILVAPEAGPHPVSSRSAYELVRRCTQSRLGASGTEPLTQRLPAGVHWPSVVRQAAFHQVSPLLHHSPALDDVNMPAEAEAAFRSSYLAAAMHNLRMVAELARLVELLQEAGIAVLPLKGPLLAHSAYDNLGLRPCSDIDLLVDPDAYEDVERVLREDGYRARPGSMTLEGLSKTVHLAIARQIMLRNEAGFHLDLHTGVMPMGYRFALPFEELHRRARPIVVADFVLPGCEPEDELLILCYHGVKNLWARLKHVGDIAALIQSHPELRWPLVFERARRTRGRRILLLGLYVAHRVAGTDLPASVHRHIAQEPHLDYLVRWVEEALASSIGAELSLRDRLRFHLLVQESLPTRLRYALYTVVRRLEDVYERSAG